MQKISDPWAIQDQRRKESKNTNTIRCPECGFDQNEPNSSFCEICESSLIEKKKVNNLKIVKTTFDSTSKDLKSRKLAKNAKKTANEILNKYIQAQKTVRKKLFKINPSLPKQLKKPGNLIGIVVLGIGISLWSNYLLTNLKPEQVKREQEGSESVSVTSSAPKGIFGYGGAPFHAPLATKGLIRSLESENPGLELRFAKPLNQDFSNGNGVKMLVEGETSVSFNGRPLNDVEYKKANLRGFQLKQLPIAIDGIVFFGNNNESISALNVEQIKGIFTGEITNWNQISSKAGDLPIVPIILDNEDLSSLGIKSTEIASEVQYTPNHTQAVRKVIATPGSISFSSASLAQDQSLIQSFDLAEGDSRAFVPGLIDGRSNLKAFRDGQYPLTRSIFVNYRADGTREEKVAKVIVDYLNSESGQKIIEESGFVRLR